jgi:hypothetical protein
MAAMAAGLLGDIAVAARRGGDDVEAIKRLASALEALVGVDPDETLKGAYVHRTIRHAVVWLNGELTGANYEHEIDKAPPQAPAGFCSNPDPLESIKEFPLTALTGAWYLLAQSDIAIDGAAGEAARLRQRLDGKIVMGLEVMLRRAQLMWATRSWNTADLPRNVQEYVEAILWLRDEAVMNESAGLPAVDGPFPKPSATGLSNPDTVATVENVLIHVAMAGGMAERRDVLAQLQAIAQRLQTAGYPGADLVTRAVGPRDSGEAKAVASWLALTKTPPPAPRDIWVAGFYLLNMKGRGPLFDGQFEDAVDRWVRRSWTFVVDQQPFLLASPPVAEELVRTALASERRGYELQAELLRTVRVQIGVSLDQDVLDYLRDA